MRVRWETSKYKAAPEFIVPDGNGRPVPLELASMKDFCAAYGVGAERQKKSIVAQPPSDAATSPLVPPPKRRARLSRSRTHVTFAVSPSPTDLHYLVQGHIPDGPRLDLVVVCRPKAGYIFAATYLVYVPPSERSQGLAYCYHLQCRPHPKEQMDTAIREIARDEMRNLLDGRCSPHRPEWGTLSPFIRVTKTSVAGGAASLVLHPARGTATLRVDVCQVAQAGLQGLDAARDLASTLPRLLAKPPGRPADYTAEEIRRSYEQHREACVRMLAEVPGDSWPPYRGAAAALHLVRKYFTSDSDTLREIATILTQGSRRPTPARIAQRILVLRTGYTPTRLRDLIRKE